jgi:hypothetical protein
MGRTPGVRQAQKKNFKITLVEWLYGLRCAKLCASWTAQAFIILRPVLRRKTSQI